MVGEVELRVRFAETDAQGVVYYANYFVWFEVARVNFLRSLGFSYADAEKAGIGFVIAEASCRYLAPARFDDLIKIRTRVEEVKNSSFTLSYEVLNAQTSQLLAQGRTVQVFVDMKGSRKPIPIPPPLKEALEKARDGKNLE
jgi:acyl-CoA thioester hydrolase